MDVSILEQLFDLGIGAAYFSIPALLLLVLIHRRDLANALRRLTIAFAAFITSCGLTHVMVSVERHGSWTAYLTYVVKAITLASSLASSALLWHTLPVIRAYPSSEELQALNDELQHTRDSLSQLVDDRTSELLREKARWQLIWERTPQILWLSHATDLVVEFYNHNFFAYTGLSSTESLLKVVHPADVDELQSVIRTANRERVGYAHKCRLRRKDGEYRWHQIFSDPLYDPVSGAVIQWCGISSDIHDTEMAIRNNTADANRKSHFLSLISHEMRTPLNGILGVTSLLHDSVLTPKQNDLLQNVGRCADELLTLVNNTIDLSTIQAGELMLNIEKFSLNSCVEDAIKVTSGQNSKNIDIINHIPASPVIDIDGDYARVHQILVNLLSNTLKFTPPCGRVEINADLIEGKDGSKKIQISVQDSGIGISEADMAKIFGLFSQLDSSSTRRVGGAGLGLAICKELVHLMKGEIWCKSTAGQGATFYFTLRVDGEQPPQSPIINAHLTPSTAHSTHPLAQSREELICSPDSAHTSNLSSSSSSQLLSMSSSSISGPAPSSPNLRTSLGVSRSGAGFTVDGGHSIPPLSLPHSRTHTSPLALSQSHTHAPMLSSSAPSLAGASSQACGTPTRRDSSSQLYTEGLIAPVRVSSASPLCFTPNIISSATVSPSPFGSSESQTPTLMRYASEHSFFGKPRSSSTETLSSSFDDLTSSMMIPLLQNSHTKILVVDDTSLNQKVLKNMLKKLGYTHVDLAADGLQALKMVCGHIDVQSGMHVPPKEDYDVIFMDMQMPVMDGIAAATAIRNHHAELTRQPHIISVSANACKDDINRCRQAGMCVHMAKPVKKDVLKEHMDEYILQVSPCLKPCPCNFLM